MNGAACDPQVDPVHGDKAGELLGEILGFEDEIVAHDATAQVVDDSGSTSAAASAKCVRPSRARNPAEAIKAAWRSEPLFLKLPHILM
jgi:hypothetical protein